MNRIRRTEVKKVILILLCWFKCKIDMNKGWQNTRLDLAPVLLNWNAEYPWFDFKTRRYFVIEFIIKIICYNGVIIIYAL